MSTALEVQVPCSLVEALERLAFMSQEALQEHAKEFASEGTIEYVAVRHGRRPKKERSLIDLLHHHIRYWVDEGSTIMISF